VLSLPSLVVIVAAYNEEEGIRATLSEVAETLNSPLCLTVDGNSTDRTVEVA
jgi:glycosyltransferase involved in cell wall biosynthesis